MLYGWSGSTLVQVMTLPDGTKPLPEPLLTYHQWNSVALRKDQISICKMSLKNTFWGKIIFTSFRVQRIKPSGPADIRDSSLCHHCDCRCASNARSLTYIDAVGGNVWCLCGLDDVIQNGQWCITMCRATWSVQIAMCKCGIGQTRSLLAYFIFIYSTHWGRVTHICVGKLFIIGSDNGLSPGRPTGNRQVYQ